MDRMTPVRGGPIDMRLGVSEKGRLCETCMKNMVDCPGHFGYVKMALPVFHIGYFKHTISILQSICKECASIMLSDEDKAKFLKRTK
mmetsp:Transcript_19920/g.14370  ORF Transcript_19920/g.14370 Transcript_19920/m.14370 type:complete len:87 (+) Transcript_19920:151-411(+)